jgi:hypothetical protein
MIKKILLSCLILIPFLSFAQTPAVLDSSDIVYPAEHLSYRRAANAFGVSHGTAGANQIWDFHTLTSSGTYIDTFAGLSAAPITYSLFFFLSSNCCNPEKNPSTIAGTTLQNVFNFYKKTSTKFQQPGFAGNVSGIPTPIMYSSPDILYKFPMHYGNIDSCRLTYTLGGAGLGFGITEERNRHNQVDGWGTIYTPSDTFVNVLRVHIKDSIALDSVNLGFNVINSIQHEYKYLAKGYDWPILTIRTTELFGFETTTGVYYRDTVHHHSHVIHDFAETINSPAAILLFPNPSQNEVILNCAETIQTILCFDLSGKSFTLPFTASNNNIKIQTAHLIAGNYYLLIKTANEKSYSGQFIKQ